MILWYCDNIPCFAFLAKQEAFSSSQHSNSADRAVLLSLATEKGDIGSVMHTLKSNIKALEGMLCYDLLEMISSSSYTLLPLSFIFLPRLLHILR
jgi:hypothetical protein